MSEPITYVGIDAHKVELHVALLVPEATEPVTWKVRNEAVAVERLRRKLEKVAPGPVACCYEAGPCGYALQRQLDQGRICCEVIAPALVPRKPGDRVKTDRRDARKLAELHRAGLLTVVQAPTRPRRRCGTCAELVMTRVRTGSGAGTGWTSCCSGAVCTTPAAVTGRRSTGEWVYGLSWSLPTEQAVVDDYLLALEHADGRLAELDAAVGRGGRQRPVPGAGGLVAVLPGNRHAECDAAARRAARRAAVSRRRGH